LTDYSQMTIPELKAAYKANIKLVYQWFNVDAEKHKHYLDIERDLDKLITRRMGGRNSNEPYQYKTRTMRKVAPNIYRHGKSYVVCIYHYRQAEYVGSYHGYAQAVRARDEALENKK
jgi:hypothetical protein